MNGNRAVGDTCQRHLELIEDEALLACGKATARLPAWYPCAMHNPMSLLLDLVHGQTTSLSERYHADKEDNATDVALIKVLKVFLVTVFSK